MKTDSDKKDVNRSDPDEDISVLLEKGEPLDKKSAKEFLNKILRH